MAMTAAERKRKQRANLGPNDCFRCSGARKKAPGFSKCAECLTENKEWSREKREVLTGEGVCTRCRYERAEADHVQCTRCLEEIAAIARERYEPKRKKPPKKRRKA